MVRIIPVRYFSKHQIKMSYTPIHVTKTKKNAYLKILFAYIYNI